MHAIDVVFRDHIRDDIHQSLPYFGYRGIVYLDFFMADYPIRVYRRMQLRIRSTRSGPRRYAVRIEPRVKLDVPRVSLRNQKFENVIPRILAPGAGDVLAPGFEGRIVKGITHSLHLKENGVDVQRLEQIQVISV